MSNTNILVLHDAPVSFDTLKELSKKQIEAVAKHLQTLQAASFFDRPIYVGDRPFVFSFDGFKKAVAAILSDGIEGKMTRAKIKVFVNACVQDFDKARADLKQDESTDVSYDRGLVSGFSNNLFYPDHKGWPFENMVPGAFWVLAERNGGKSFFVSQKIGSDFIIRISEPTEKLDSDPRVIGFTDYRHAFAASVLLGLLGLRVSIDSLRGVVFSVRGNATTGGYSSGLFELATVLSNVVAEVGVNVVMSLNPMTGGNETLLSELGERLESSVAGVITLKDRGQVVSKHLRALDGNRVTDSNSEGPDSDPHAMAPMAVEAPHAPAGMEQHMGHSVMIRPLTVEPVHTLDTGVSTIANIIDTEVDPLVERAQRRTISLG